MRLFLPLILAAELICACIAVPLAARDIVSASAPEDVSVTMYRDPEREPDDEMDADWPEGFAMISEVRTVILPAGESTIRFEGVAEGMVAVSAIVTGLPGGTIEKNRNADLLSPAALVNGSLGNRVTITRTNPATGASAAENATVMTRADGGLVLQTRDGFEAVRCSGLPEKLTFDQLPTGLSAKPVFSIDTRDPTGGTYQVTLTYLAWGFDWQAHYVATLDEQSAKGEVGMHLRSWLTLLNDNGQSFVNANLLAVAGTINVESDFQGLSDPPRARPLRLTCYPVGSTAAGTPVPTPVREYAFAQEELMDGGAIIVTGARMKRSMMEAPAPVAMIGMQAREEQLGDLKLYRVPERVAVSAKGVKQVAFLDKDKVRGELLYEVVCVPGGGLIADPEPADLVLATVNDEAHGLGVAMPMGGFTLFEPSSSGDLLVNEQTLRDYAVGQDIELALGSSSTVFSLCQSEADRDEDEGGNKWLPMSVTLSNPNSSAVTVRLLIGASGQWETRRTPGQVRVKDGDLVTEVRVPAGKSRTFKWKIREAVG